MLVNLMKMGIGTGKELITGLMEISMLVSGKKVSFMGEVSFSIHPEINTLVNGKIIKNMAMEL